jgi:hypothetical protein
MDVVLDVHQIIPDLQGMAISTSLTITSLALIVKSSLIGGPSTWTVDCTDGSTYGDLLIPQ